MDLDTKISNVMHYTSTDKIFDLTLKFELDLIVFVQILELSRMLSFMLLVANLANTKRCNISENG